MDWFYIVPPIAGAVIGLFTNQLAIWMLFQPRKKWTIGKMGVPFTPGVVPRDREMIIEKVADLIEERLLSSEDVLDMLKNSGLKSNIVDVIDEVIDEKLGGSLVPENLLYNIKLVISKQVIQFLDDFLEKYSEQLVEGIQVKETITEKMEDFSNEEIEAMIYEASGRHLRMITLFGGVLGFVMGLLQVVWFHFA